MKTYDEILKHMKKTYYDETGNEPDDASGAYKLMEIFASELYSLSCYADWTLKQNFVQTAEGEYLEKLGELRSCCRKTPTHAKGTIRFYLPEALEEDFEIPKGTICAVTDSPYLQYATDERAVITAGRTRVDINATALGTGNKYNVGLHEIKTMVNVPVGISKVNNYTRFIGGYDGESDNELRNRIIRNYNIQPNGLNNTTLENQVLLLDYIYDCHIPYCENTGELVVYVASKLGALTAQQRAEIENQLQITRILGLTVDIREARVKTISGTFVIDNKSGYSTADLRQKISSTFESFTDNSRIGEPILLSVITSTLMNIEGISNAYFNSRDIVGNQIYCEADEILRLGDYGVTFLND